MHLAVLLVADAVLFYKVGRQGALPKAPPIPAHEPIPEIPLKKFLETKPPVDSIVHLKGFCNGMADGVYEKEALAALAKYKLLVWDGDPYEASGFTKLIPLFLNANPDARAIAFKDQTRLGRFKEAWGPSVDENKFGDRLSVVGVSLKDAAKFGLKDVDDDTDELVTELPGWARGYFLLGRIAIKATGSKSVVSLGGGRIAGKEALASFPEGVHWTVFALSRGKKEENPTLLDFAAEHEGDPKMTFVEEGDKNEKGGYTGYQYHKHVL